MSLASQIFEQFNIEKINEAIAEAAAVRDAAAADIARLTMLRDAASGKIPGKQGVKRGSVSVKQQVFDLLKVRGPLKAAEIGEALPAVKPSAISQALSGNKNLFSRGDDATWNLVVQQIAIAS